MTDIVVVPAWPSEVLAGGTPDDPARPVLEARELVKHFGTSEALRGISAGVRPGEIVAVMGPSGSGA